MCLAVHAGIGDLSARLTPTAASRWLRPCGGLCADGSAGRVKPYPSS